MNSASNQSTNVIESIIKNSKIIKESTEFFKNIEFSNFKLKEKMNSMGEIVKEQVKISDMSNKVGKKINDAIATILSSIELLKTSVNRFKTAV